MKKTCFVILAAAIFFLAGVSDMLDGIIARRFNLISELGKILDPLADKLMIATVFFCLTVKEIIPVWLVLIIAAKEFCMLLGGFKLHKEAAGIFSSNSIGKFSTFFLTSGGLLFLVFPNLDIIYKNVYSALAALLIIISFLSYFKAYQKVKKS